MGPPKTSELERLLRQAPVAPPAVLVYLAARIGAALRRSAHARAGVAFGLAMVLGIGYIGSSAGTTPTATATVPQPILPLTQAAFATAVSTNRALTEPATIRFSAPMDRASVAASITLDPPTPVTLAWDDSGTVLTVAPRDHWAAGTFQTVTVESGALALSGQPLARPVRSVFLTRDATTASAVATQPAGDRVAVGTAFVVTFARPVEAGSLAGAVRLDPPTLGTIDEVTTQAGVTGLAFLPMRALLPDVAYRLSVVGVRDTDGLPLDPVVLMVHTAKAPTVVRFRPHAGTGGIARDATMSVRFSMPMDRTSTAHAFTVSSHGKAIAGTVAWAEHDTVLLFTPKAALPRASSVSMAVGLDATAVGGAPLAVAGHATFRTIGSRSPGNDRHGGLALGAHLSRERRRWRQLGVRRDVLPRADELHADGRLGHLVGRLQQPGRAQRRAAQARHGDQLKGEPPVRPDDGDRQRVQPLHRGQPGHAAARRWVRQLQVG